VVLVVRAGTESAERHIFPQDMPSGPEESHCCLNSSW
jgi:hypothetical protein